MRRALFPGSFDPFTIGHESIVRRALNLFDEIVIAIGVNSNKTPKSEVEHRVCAIQRLYKDEPRIKVLSYDTLTMDLVKEQDCCCILRGVRDVKDYEYETELARANFLIGGGDTVFLIAGSGQEGISSSLVRELKSYGKDVSGLLPEGIEP